jgi:hypothetical protein
MQLAQLLRQPPQGDYGSAANAMALQQPPQGGYAAATGPPAMPPPQAMPGVGPPPGLPQPPAMPGPALRQPPQGLPSFGQWQLPRTPPDGGGNNLYGIKPGG